MKDVETLAVDPRSLTSSWQLVLCLVGIDYFSTLAYLPSLANEVAGPLAPFAAAGVVAVTFLLALPAYVYVVGRSTDGRGATGLMQRTIAGWRGKFLILVMMGFVASDFIITRSLSTSDAAVHLLANPHLNQVVNNHAVSIESLEPWMGTSVVDWLRPYWTRQVAVTLALSLITLVFWFVFASGFTRRVLWFAAFVVLLYLGSTLYIVLASCWELLQKPALWQQWWTRADHQTITGIEGAVFMLLLVFPQLVLGISGFELSMTVMPLIDAGKGNSETQKRRRIRRARWMLACLTLVMGFFLISSTLVTTIQIEPSQFLSEKSAQHRALAYLAHSPGYPAWFGTWYDFITALILCLAGVSVTVSLRDLVPGYLHRLGMELTWARKYGVFMLLCNGIILMATLVFKASVEAQEGAYATSVLVLLAGANLAAAADVRRRYRLTWPVLTLPFVTGLLFFLAMALVMAWRQPGGLVLSILFLILVFLTSIWSRWRRSMELRFSGFRFADESSATRWQEMIKLEFQILAPHRPGHFSVLKKNDDIRSKFRIDNEVPIIFIEVELGDTSEFEHMPLIQIDLVNGLEVIRVSKCSSVAHVVAAIALEFSNFGRPPEVIFGWSRESPLSANLNFLLFGQGNIPWMVKELVIKQVADDASCPRIVIG